MQGLGVNNFHIFTTSFILLNGPVALKLMQRGMGFDDRAFALYPLGVRAVMRFNTYIKTALVSFAVGLLSACQTVPEKTPIAEPVVEAAAETETPQYEPLVYGTQKPLVCTTEFPDEGKLFGRPNLQVMWENYLYDRPEGIWGEIGGFVEINGNLPLDQGRWTNACTVRLSHMLNKAGHKIPRAKGNKTVSGGNKDQYYYRVLDIEEYLKETFGPPLLNLDDGSANSFDLPPRPGIVLMDFPDGSYTGHVTVWNGAGTVDGANIGGYRVLFWELPCFIPEDRAKAVAALFKLSAAP